MIFLSDSLNLFMPQFPHLRNEGMYSFFNILSSINIIRLRNVLTWLKTLSWVLRAKFFTKKKFQLTIF